MYLSRMAAEMKSRLSLGIASSAESQNSRSAFAAACAAACAAAHARPSGPPLWTRSLKVLGNALAHIAQRYTR